VAPAGCDVFVVLNSEDPLTSDPVQNDAIRNMVSSDKGWNALAMAVVRARRAGECVGAASAEGNSLC